MQTFVIKVVLGGTSEMEEILFEAFSLFWMYKLMK